MKVKNMPRKQQKAVFANIKDPDEKYLYVLEGAEKYQKRRAYLIRKKEIAEDYEDKIYEAWNDPKLTYVQRQHKVAKLQKEAREELDKAQKEESSKTITSDIREIRQKRLSEQEKKRLLKEHERGKS